MSHETSDSMHPSLHPVEPVRAMSAGLQVLAILGIVLGVLGILSNFVCGVGTSIIAIAVVDFIPEEFRTGLPEGAMGYVMLGVNLVNGFVSILLLVAGLGLHRRRPAAVGRYRLWAVIRIICVIVTAVATFFTQYAAMEAQMADDGGPGVVMSPMLIAVPSALFTLVWGLALPIFALIWLQRESVIREIAQWTPVADDRSAHFTGHV